MQATVWTSWNTKAETHDKGRPKCIFVGEIQTVPREGEYVVVREGFCAERVESVIHDFVHGTVEIKVSTPDRDNEYGECLVLNA